MGTSTKQYSSVPIQKLPMRKKNTKWKEDSVDAYIGKASGTTIRGRSEAEDLKIKYDLYNSKFNIDDLEYVIDPYKVGEGFPASPQNFNIIRPKIDLLLGEESKRPNTLKVIQTNRSGISKAESVEIDLLMNYVMAQVADKQVSKEETPEEILRYMKYGYSDVAEKTAYNALKYLEEKLGTRNELLKGWKDALIAGKEIYYVGVIGDSPIFERVNPIGFYYDKSPDLEFIEDGDWAVRHMLMTPNSIYDRFYDVMEESDLNNLLDMIESGGGSSFKNNPNDVNYNRIIYKTDLDRDSGNDGSSTETYLDVYHVTWKSYKKVGFLTTIDENGEETVELVDESYKFDETDKLMGNKISWEWITEVWEGYRIGDDIYVGIQPLSNQTISVENPNNAKLPYIGAIYSDSNSEYTSLVDIMKPLQYMYIIIWYRLELALARDKGKVLIMDPTQIPKSMGIDVAKWAHYLSSMGVVFVNPYEEGWDVPGRSSGNPASFNQISAQDLSMSRVIADYIGLMQKIEDMIGELSGVTKQRQGSISQNELVGNVERSVIQSSHITEPLFWKHNQVKKRAYVQLLEAAKYAWSDSGKESLHFVLDDMSRSFIKISEDFLYSDFDVFVSDSTKEDRDLQALRSLAEPAVQSGATLHEVSELLTSDNITILKNKLKELDERKQILEQKAVEAQQQAEQQRMQFESQKMAEENRIKEEDSIRKANTDIEVALIQSRSKLDAAEMSDNDEEQLRKLELQREKQTKDAELQSRKIEEDIRKNRVSEEIKRKELEIKRKQANNKPKNN